MQRKLVNTLPSEVEAAARLEELFEERFGVLVGWIDSTGEVLDLDFITEV